MVSNVGLSSQPEVKLLKRRHSREPSKDRKRSNSIFRMSSRGKADKMDAKKKEKEEKEKEKEKKKAEKEERKRGKSKGRELERNDSLVLSDAGIALPVSDTGRALPVQRPWILLHKNK